MWDFITSPVGAVLTGLLILPLMYVLIRWARSGYRPALPAGAGGFFARNWARINANPWVAGILAAALAAIIAVIMYPVVLTGDFWLQQPGGIPLLLWILVPLIAALIIWNLPREEQIRLAVVILATVVFFTVLGLYLSDGLDIGLRKKLLYIVAICTSFALAYYVGRSRPGYVGQPRLCWAFALATFGILGISHIVSYSDIRAGTQSAATWFSSSWTEATEAGKEWRKSRDAREASAERTPKPATALPTRTANSLVCDGMDHTVTLTSIPQRTPSRGNFAWSVVGDGGVKLTDNHGFEHPEVYTRDSKARVDFIVTWWRSTTPMAYVSAKCS